MTKLNQIKKLEDRIFFLNMANSKNFTLVKLLEKELKYLKEN